MVMEVRDFEKLLNKPLVDLTCDQLEEFIAIMDSVQPDYRKSKALPPLHMRLPGDISYHDIATTENIADCLSKNKYCPAFKKFRINVIPLGVLLLLAAALRQSDQSGMMAVQQQREAGPGPGPLRATAHCPLPLRMQQQQAAQGLPRSWHCR